MAEIFRGKTIGAEGFEREIAIKRILPHFTEDENFVRMFIDEATIAAKLHHANIVQIFDFDIVDDTYYIAMEYVSGRNLKQMIKKGRKSGNPVGVWQSVSIITEVAKALHYAHTRTHKGRPLDIVHRDVSPQNVMVNYSGEIKITDFGIAKATERSTKTRAGTVKGKCAYMSPEQARGKPLDQRSDLFALGIILWELLTRKRLFAGETDFETLSNVLKCSVEPPSSFSSQVPPELDEVLTKVLTKDPNDRFENCDMFHRELSRLFYSNVDDREDVSVGVTMQTLFADEIQALAEAEQGEHSDIIQDLVRQQREGLSQNAPSASQSQPSQSSGGGAAVPAIGDGVNDPNLADQDLQETMPLSDLQAEVLARLKINPKAARENRVDSRVSPKTAPKPAGGYNPETGTFTGVDTRRPLSPLVAGMLLVGIVGMVIALGFFRSERADTQTHPGGELATPPPATSLTTPPTNRCTLTFAVHPDDVQAAVYVNGVRLLRKELTGLRKGERIKVFAEAQGVRSQDLDVLVSQQNQVVDLVVPIQSSNKAKIMINAPGAAIWVGDEKIGENEVQYEGNSKQKLEIRADFGKGRTVTRKVELGTEPELTILPPLRTEASLQIDVTPQQATIVVNGQTYKTTDGSVRIPNLELGQSLKIRATESGYDSFSKDFILETIEGNLKITLMKPTPAAPKATKPKPPTIYRKVGYVTINARPWADVYYKGRKIGLTPIRKRKFPVGEISLTLKHPKKEKNITVIVEEGEHNVLKVVNLIP